MVRISGDVVDLDIRWRNSCGPNSVQREPTPQDVVRRRIREEDKHVCRYIYRLETQALYNSRWQVMYRLPNTRSSFSPVMVPVLWVQSVSRVAPQA